MAMKRESGGSKKPVKRAIIKAKATKSRGSKSAEQMGNMNARENVRVNKYYKDIVSKKTVDNAKAKDAANAKAKNGIPRLDEASAPRRNQRAGGGKNLSTTEMGSKKRSMPAAPAGRRTAKKVPATKRPGTRGR
jgi:hypothetical protein